MKRIVLSVFVGLFVTSNVAMQYKEKNDLKNIKRLQDSEILIFIDDLEELSRQYIILFKSFKKDKRDSEKATNKRLQLKEKVNNNKPVVIKPLKTVH